MLEDVAEAMEQDVTWIGVTANEDKLQDNVP
jgi:magnesium-transporting ATPase (P-type)